MVLALLAALASAPNAPIQSVSAAGPFTVNTTNDTHDSNTGDGICSDGSGCSLRAALEQANASAGTTTINLPPGTYNLSLGDLVAGTQANTNITLHGTGTSANTTIHQTLAGRMVFVVNYNVNANVVFSLDNVTVSGGSENENDPDGFGGNGGAILAGGSTTATGNSVSITSVIFSGNYCSPVANAGCSGGAINMTGGGDLTVTNSTFSGNDASKNTGTGSGGAIYFDNGGNPGNVSITNSTFTNNIAHNSGGQGGAVRLAGGSSTTYTVNNNTFTGNSATQNSGALYLSLGSLTANFNRIVGNTSNSGSGLFVANNSGSIGVATNNWWGCNGGPGAAGCDTAILGSGGGGSLTFNPWIVLSNTASPNPILVNQSTTLTASFLQNSAGTPLSASNLDVLIGLPITFNNAVLGSLSGAQTTIQSNGTATATFTAGNAIGTGHADAKVDNGTATANITIKDTPITGLQAANSSPTRVGSSTAFTATITAGSNVNYAWDFGDGPATASGATTSHIYTSVGFYTARITATNSVSTVVATTPVTITDTPITGLSASNSSPTRLGSATAFTATASGSNIAYQWNFGDGVLGSGAHSSHTYLAVGSYTARVTATNSVSIVVATTPVTITDTPITGLSASNSSPTVAGNSTAFTATITGGSNASYTWSFGDGSIGSGATTTHAYVAGGVYTALVTATNGVGQVMATTPVTITEAPITGLSATNDSPTPLGRSTTLTASIVTGSNVLYQWNFGDALPIATGNPVTHTYGVTGTFTVIITSTNSVSSMTATTQVTITTPIAYYIYLPLVAHDDDVAAN